MNYVNRRGKVYCTVISVPTDLRDLIGKKQIWRSLKTKNYSIAWSQARKLLLTVDRPYIQAGICRRSGVSSGDGKTRRRSGSGSGERLN